MKTQSQKQTRIEELLNLALKELGNIENLSKSCTGSAIGTGLQISEIFQHSQRGLNALHDLKNALSMNEVASHE